MQQVEFDELRQGRTHQWTEALYILYMLITLILLYNLLIAKLSDTFKSINTSSEEQWMVQWAHLIMGKYVQDRPDHECLYLFVASFSVPPKTSLFIAEIDHLLPWCDYYADMIGYPPDIAQITDPAPIPTGNEVIEPPKRQRYLTFRSQKGIPTRTDVGVWYGDSRVIDHWWGWMVWPMAWFKKFKNVQSELPFEKNRTYCWC